MHRIRIKGRQPSFPEAHSVKSANFDVSKGGKEVCGPQVTKLEQVSSDDHQMSVVGCVEYWIRFE